MRRRRDPPACSAVLPAAVHRPDRGVRRTCHLAVSISEHGTPSSVALVARGIDALTGNLERVIVGKRPELERAVAVLLAGGHLLLQDVPGVGKTVLARAMARSIGGTFKRVQATPDLLPSDITGGMVYDGGRGTLRFVAGPVFANVVLADELNRATPRTQSAFLEAMGEAQVSVEGTAYPLPQPFFLIATLNPLEHHGTYPLPEGQLDRFLASMSLGYPRLEDEVEVIARQQVAHPLDCAPLATGGAGGARGPLINVVCGGDRGRNTDPPRGHARRQPPRVGWVGAAGPGVGGA
ncbi:MAG: hypothetical protein E6G98_13160 [Bacillati bacterium ANGP1]|uniref:AAA+ ATPase domain-containing protein n=1 Tax=Candidatus Segetimicrobium genomatis TaxID=2569760 RepID=A0A537LIK3_9BACT|nr:MAG: hypothetical protein E6G98_13160 [Terrabacteria group bacterium ANGP1]